MDLDSVTRSYLDINCGHCHNEAGAADTSGLLLDYEDHAPGALGVCKPPIAAGRGSGGFNYSIVPGDAANSIMPFRMRTTSPATMMPELGRSLAHAEGVALINDWVNAMQVNVFSHRLAAGSTAPANTNRRIMKKLCAEDSAEPTTNAATGQSPMGPKPTSSV